VIVAKLARRFAGQIANGAASSISANAAMSVGFYSKRNAGPSTFRISC
jgi:hypothetical protein